MNVNRVTLIGYTTTKPELRKTPNGHSFTSFGLATNRMWKDASTGEKRKAAEFHSLIAWRKLAECITEYVTKGERLYVDGRLQTRSWTDKAGNKKKTTEIVADSIIMLGTGKGKKKVTEDTDKPLEVKEEVSAEEVPF